MCIICFENKKEYNLSCNHSFCINCLSKILQSDLDMKCPLCRKNIIKKDINHIKKFLPRQTRSDTLDDRKSEFRDFVLNYLVKINITEGLSNKKILTIQLLNYIFANKWFFNLDQHFYNTMIQKIEELSNDHKEWADINIFYYKFKNLKI
tara:strand:- start:195 stop:644 length:450 start_codon:yes stop_codon:yes gene_type:complete